MDEKAITIREATRADVADLERIRGLVRENRLSTPIARERLLAGLESRGKGWIAHANDTAVGFSMADLETSSIWALSLLPEWERRGLGSALLDRAIAWLREQRCSVVWLSTAHGTRAVGFYEHLGWRRTGDTQHGEARFEITL